MKGGQQLVETLFNDPERLGVVDRAPFATVIDSAIARCNADDQPKVSAVISVCGGLAQYIHHPKAKMVDRPEWAPWNGLGIVGTVAKPEAFLTRQSMAEKGDAIWGP